MDHFGGTTSGFDQAPDPEGSQVRVGVERRQNW